MRNSFIGKRLMGCKYASIGAWKLIKNEASIQVQIIIAIGITIAGFVFDISSTEWVFQILAISIVMAAEGLNTAVEEIANFVHPEYHSKIGYIKDVAAGAVFFAAIGAVIIACIIYIPKF
ncbi:diacylglycerol kinase [Patiriisocius marinus]|uniref:Diacylglycerol kinase n=1 Tax=Patiriisocius marinus TaxID=1397112 RepID=A0A5J4IZY7_9FLAO|nr:diacylglycerol kinase family protein [Patiriisocius marinus]GER59063.1 diacylglycerol kinase [Patiriisocius marinus]